MNSQHLWNLIKPFADTNCTILITFPNEENIWLENGRNLTIQDLPEVNRLTEEIATDRIIMFNLPYLLGNPDSETEPKLHNIKGTKNASTILQWLITHSEGTFTPTVIHPTVNNGTAQWFIDVSGFPYISKTDPEMELVAEKLPMLEHFFQEAINMGKTKHEALTHAAFYYTLRANNYKYTQDEELA